MNGWRPSSRPDAARRRAELLDRARDHFATHDVLAVDAPSLSRFAGSDTNIDSFAVRSMTGQELYLHTSPEFRMKRLLADGYPDIYSICRVYRDGESGRQHLPEFTMIEWYRHDFDLGMIIADATALIASCLDATLLSTNALTLEYRDAFAKYADIDVFTATDEELAGCAGADQQLRQAVGADRDAWLDLILTSVVIPQLPPDQMTVLQHFPASKAALARLCPHDQRVADRFEVFMRGLELANGCVELSDVEEQRRRINQDLTRRRDGNRAVLPPDKHFLHALEAGLPDCAGVAVGVERLQMILDQTEDIRNVVTFAFEDDDD